MLRDCDVDLDKDMCQILCRYLHKYKTSIQGHYFNNIYTYNLYGSYMLWCFDLNNFFGDYTVVFLSVS